MYGCNESGEQLIGKVEGLMLIREKQGIPPFVSGAKRQQ
jgi:hypothetical protein